MNPFTIGQSLTVVFGSRQRWCIERVTPQRCAMRMPGLTTPALLWFTVAQLLTWNPQTAPKVVPVQPVYLLPALIVRSQPRRRVQMQLLCVGNVIAIFGGRYAIYSIGPVYISRPFPNAPAHVTEPTRDAVLVDVTTGEKRDYPFRNIGHGAERVEGQVAS